MIKYGVESVKSIDRVVKILASLRNNREFVFRLTGSRYFGNSHPDSDWDFFVEHNTEVERFLENEGFDKISKSNYDDQRVVSIWQCHNVHIQCVNDADQKAKIQQVLKDFGIVATRTDWWDIYEAIDTLQKYGIKVFGDFDCSELLSSKNFEKLEILRNRNDVFYCRLHFTNRISIVGKTLEQAIRRARKSDLL